MKKNYQGIIEYSFSIYLLLFSSVMLLYVFRMEIWSAVRRQTEDALVSANLAAAVIDTTLYDEENVAVISDPEAAYEHFRKALGDNLRLNEEMIPANSYLFPGKVSVEAFYIYNVYGDEVERITLAEDGSSSAETVGSRGSVRTPNGKTVEYTSIYSRIGFRIGGLFGQTFDVQKENCVDIAAEFQEEEEDEEKEDL